MHRVACRFMSAKATNPTPPPGTGTVFHSLMPPVKIALSGPKWTAIALSGITGAFAGNFFYKAFIMRKNPPNPIRDPDEVAPLSHPHTPAEED
ncbi:hypothetical protein IE077_000423 [Cardiosporidium cionae]|uniref:Transmembrane protein n=1 Tax=Cardiosporidium cionae TaxID=476202 RepID=A0ABQ7J9M7_9APIC|nr:hypothetical protein IE077_000423 [Cardiosporidium cionae]|eukprot:KAF8820718.1 hypothetical protein IE077_000423 [Cardiosporidium cionae]